METVIAAVVTGLFGVALLVIGNFLKKFDKRNTSQHEANQSLLLKAAVNAERAAVTAHLAATTASKTAERVEKHFEILDGKIDRHIAWHMDQEMTS